jgi:hypothetical protein
MPESDAEIMQRTPETKPMPAMTAAAGHALLGVVHVEQESRQG